MKKLTLAGVAGAMALAVASSANATIVTVFDDVAGGRASFDSTVTGTGATVNELTLAGLASGMSVDAGPFTITNNDGGTVFFSTYGTLSGQVVSIDPATVGDDFFGSGVRDEPEDYFGSGFTLTFDDAVNSVGFEVGDWATCCTDPVTELYISFDGGTPILVASADDTSQGLFPSQDPGVGFDVFEIFVAAFDDTDSFTTVSFWGNGLGEVLVAGGNVRWALVDEDTLPEVPVPAAAFLFAPALAGFAMRSRAAKK
ncbi:MAG: PEP-CTERM sorting domain-containing protein [Pseudomonadota bacterium]